MALNNKFALSTLFFKKNSWIFSTFMTVKDIIEANEQSLFLFLFFGGGEDRRSVILSFLG